MTTKFHDDLDWSAFLYVSGEMSREEAEAFEQLLADDQAAREAVAASVELSTTVLAACDRHVQRASVAPWLRNAGLLAMGAAACLLVMFLLNRNVNKHSVVKGLAAPPVELAILWSETRDEWENDDELTDADLVEIDAEQGDQGLVDEDALSTPAWMTAAISELSGEINESETPSQEN